MRAELATKGIAMLSESSMVAIGMSCVSGLMAVLWWLLRHKDAQQQREISDMKEQHSKDVQMLLEKHSEDVERLRDLELTIAKTHYVKTELDHKFDKLEGSIRTGLNDLGNKLDTFGEKVVARLVSEKR